MDRQRFGSVVIALLVLSSAFTVAFAPVGPQVTGTAEASHRCDFSDSLTLSVVNSFTGSGTLGEECTLLHDPVDDENLTQLDAYETKVSLYNAGLGILSQQNIIDSAYSNYFNDTRGVARTIGLQAYIEAYNNDSTKTQAKAAAKAAIADYYATKQLNLAKAWNIQTLQIKHMDAVAGNTSALGTHELFEHIGVSTAIYTNGTASDSLSRPWANIQPQSAANTSINLVNGSSTNVARIRVNLEFPTSGDTSYHYLDLTTGTVSYTSTNGDGTISSKGLSLEAPDSNYETKEYIRFQKWADRWDQIQNQTTNAQAELDTLINNSFAELERGEIDTGDLLTPQMLTREYDPGTEFQAWVSATLAGTGAGLPTNYNNTGYMDIQVQGGQLYRGVLAAESNPPTGQWETNVTYNASEIPGTEYIVYDGGIEPLRSGNFTIQTIHTQDGENISSFQTRSIDYSVANVSDYREILQDLRSTQAEINGHQQRERNVAGGGLLGDVVQHPILFVGGAIAVLLLLGVATS